MESGRTIRGGRRGRKREKRSSHPSLSLSPPRHGFFSRAQKNSRNVVVDRRPLSGRAASEPHGRKLFETEKLDIRCASWPRGFSFREREATGAGGNERREERANWKREGYMIYGRRNRIFVRLWTSFGRRGTRLKGSCSTVEWNFSAIRENLTAAEGGAGWRGQMGDVESGGESSNFVLRRSLFRLIREGILRTSHYSRPPFIAT